MTFLLFFFFQAEDGIRDGTVTGVQTCALPISTAELSPARCRRAGESSAVAAGAAASGRRLRAFPADPVQILDAQAHEFVAVRSEERRVGKECRYGASAEHWKKKEVRVRMLA